MRARGFLLFSLGFIQAGCSDPGATATSCVAALLPLQNPRAHTLGETFYLPRLDCGEGAAWTVAQAPPGSASRVFMTGAPEPRFTPDVPGEYELVVAGVRDGRLRLRVVARTPAERFQNHYLTPLYGAARVGDEVWTANGATYTVSRLRPREDGGFDKLAEISVGSWPAAVAWREPLPYVLVAQRGADTLGFVDRARGVLDDALWVGDEPVAVAIAPDARRAYVSLATMRQIAVVDLETRAVFARVDVAFDPRALALSSDGARLYVASYRSGNRAADRRGTYGADDDRDLTVVDTATLQTVARVDGVSSVLRAIALGPGDAELFVVGTDGDPEPSQADPSAKPFVHELVVVSAEPAAADFGRVRRRVDLTRQPGSGGPVVNPAGVLADGDTVWVAAESSEVVVALDAQTLAEKRRVTVGEGARQLVPVPGGVAVHCFQSRALYVVRPDGDAVGTVIAGEARPAEVALGERVFARPGGAWAQNHSCSSCHVETQNEGMIWRFGTSLWNNVRPLQMLAATTPLGWHAYVSSAASFGYQGPASIVSRPATPEEAVGLQRFLASLVGAPRATGHTRLDGSYTEAARRGQALFEGRVGCASCHVPPLYTSRKLVPEGKSGVPADVPSLLGAYRHGIYFVAGQARRLEDALDVALRFVSAEVTDAERADLLAFLRELTPKGAAPLAIWPDVDSAKAVDPGVAPEVAFAEPFDETSGASPGELVVLDDATGAAVAGGVEVDGLILRFVPASPLEPGAAYTFRVRAGLPFRSGGVLDGERATRFEVARPPVAAWPEALEMTVEATGPRGPTTLPLRLTRTGTRNGALEVELQPMMFGAQQRQSLWLRLDGDAVYLEPFALPISPGGVANAADVVGKITATEGGRVTRVEGTLRLGGPSIDVPGVPFTLTAP